MISYILSEISCPHGGEYEDDCLLLTASIRMEAVSTHQASVNFYQTTWRNIPEDSHLQKLIRFWVYDISFLVCDIWNNKEIYWRLNDNKHGARGILWFWRTWEIKEN
jgi:hypothetical protein